MTHRRKVQRNRELRKYLRAFWTAMGPFIRASYEDILTRYAPAGEESD